MEAIEAGLPSNIFLQVSPTWIAGTAVVLSSDPSNDTALSCGLGPTETGLLCENLKQPIPTLYAGLYLSLETRSSTMASVLVARDSRTTKVTEVHLCSGIKGQRQGSQFSSCPSCDIRKQERARHEHAFIDTGVCVLLGHTKFAIPRVLTREFFQIVLRQHQAPTKSINQYRVCPGPLSVLLS